MSDNKPQKPMLFKIGIVLFILCNLLWIAAAVIPFTSLTVYIKTVIISSALICAEIMFWVSVLLLGKEVVKKYKSYLNPRNWRKKADIIKEKNNDIDNI